ncbi:hypothetical protein VPMG_00114 [Vibrio phage VBP32]|uniref:Uncharacterized protein n=2 Tax=Stoningtonvirus VBP47 TaxID=2846606 RepID=M4T2H8_9CAUD|nr:hypothetical protein VPNG_00015 [Vibrio phage VBP47]YP_007676604.1 hypothetical protein VPMG_00114 [Vibrio phage VBP32]AGH57039.1 hypothetical protein VPNG_00015 [Vibrio phage VBP47]AGH57253.1 hypothetical protein VPMG_00114 [Vibrio phage VBP32]
MNQTQKKFLINQASKIVGEKLTQAEADSKEVMQKRRNYIHDPVVMRDAIVAGDIKPAANPAGTETRDLFLLKPFLTKRQKEADKMYGKVAKLDVAIFIPNPYEKYNYNLRSLSGHYSYTVECIDRVKALANSMEEFIEEVMIGDSETARKLLAGLKEL